MIEVSLCALQRSFWREIKSDTQEPRKNEYWWHGPENMLYVHDLGVDLVSVPQRHEIGLAQKLGRDFRSEEKTEE